MLNAFLLLIFMSMNVPVRDDDIATPWLALFVTRSTLIRPSPASEARGYPTPATAGGR